jgi:type IV secretory pathway VirB4 component
MPNFANSQNLVEVEEIRESTLILKGGGLRQILMVSGVNFALKSEEEQNSISAAYANFLNSIDFSIQIIVHSRKINIEKYLADLDRKMAEEQSPLLQNQIGEYREFIRQFVEENAIMSKSFLVVVPWQSAGVSEAVSGISSILPFKKKQPAEQAKLDEAAKAESFKKNLEQLRQRTDQVTDGLSAVGLDVVLLNDEQLAELFYNFYNPETTEKGSLNLPKEK